LKQIIIIIIYFPIFLFALNPFEITLIEEVLTTLFHKEKIYIYYPYPLKSSHLIQTSCDKSDIVLGDFKCNKPKFVFSYEKFLTQENVIGALYWRKGRPQLRIKEEGVKKFHLYLNKELMDFVE